MRARQGRVVHTAGGNRRQTDDPDDIGHRVEDVREALDAKDEGTERRIREAQPVIRVRLARETRTRETRSFRRRKPRQANDVPFSDIQRIRVLDSQAIERRVRDAHASDVLPDERRVREASDVTSCDIRLTDATRRYDGVAL